MSSAQVSQAVQRILVVDDTPANLYIMTEHLQAKGYTTLIAEDGVEALQRAEYALPDLILLDVMLPGLDGFEVCRRLKANPLTSAIPVIFMTALHDERDKLEGFAAGGVDYVTKPFQRADVLARIDVHLSLHAAKVRLLAQKCELEQQIAARQQVEFDLRFQATHDMLTGLPNRILLYDRLHQAIASARRSGRRFIVCFIDLDHFKCINDSLGHTAGDELLKVVATRMCECVRSLDTVARLGGDEFVLLLRELDDVALALSTVRRVAAEVGRPIHLAAAHDQEVAVT